MWPGDTPEPLPKVNLLSFRVRRVGGGVGGQVLKAVCVLPYKEAVGGGELRSWLWVGGLAQA